MKRREFLIGAGGVGLLGLLTACSAPGGTTGSSTQVAFFNDVPTWSPGFQSANTYLKTLAGATLSPRSVPTSASYQQVIQSQLQTTNPPDVAKWGSGYQLQDIARTGTLYPLDDIWKEAIGKGWVPASLQDIFRYHGKTYAMPLQQGYYVMFYNVKLFDRLGITVPATWDEFLQACATLKSNGVTPLGATQVNSWPIAVWLSVFAASYDAQWYQDISSNKARWSDEKGIAFLTLWKEMIAKGWFTSADTSIDDIPSLMQKEMFAEAVSWETQSIDATGMKPTTGYDAFILPNADGSKTSAIITEVAGLIVPKRGHDRERALTSLRHWMDPRPQRNGRPSCREAPRTRRSPGRTSRAGTSRRSCRTPSSPSSTATTRTHRLPLVQGNLQDLGGFMASPGDVRALASSMDHRADTDWKYWTRRRRHECAPEKQTRTSSRWTRAGFLTPRRRARDSVRARPRRRDRLPQLLRRQLHRPGFVGLGSYIQVLSDPAILRSAAQHADLARRHRDHPRRPWARDRHDDERDELGKWARLAVVLPYALSGSAVAIVWNAMLQNDGAINTALAAFGLHGPGWLLSWPLDTVSLIVANSWQATGVAVILYLVGLQGVPRETIEAARARRRRGLRRFTTVVFPQMRATTAVVLGISLANGLKSFDLIWVLTQEAQGGRPRPWL